MAGIFALPLAIAFAIASGAPPEAGLFTAIVSGFLSSALGGFGVQIGGPTGALVVIVCGVIQKLGMDGLAVATMMAGVILSLLGAVKLGGAIMSIPCPVTTGFTTGIAVISFSSQVRDFLGLHMTSEPADFVEKWQAQAGHVGAISPWTAAVAPGSLAIILHWPRLSHRIPSSFAALVVATAATHPFHLPVETIGDRFGSIHAALPMPQLPTISLR